MPVPSNFSSNNDPLTYVWDFGNGDSDTGVLVHYSYPEAGIFPITLTVSGGELQDIQAYAYRAAYYEALCGAYGGSMHCWATGGIDGNWERTFNWRVQGSSKTGLDVIMGLPTWGNYTWLVELEVIEELPGEIDGVQVLTQGASYEFSVRDSTPTSSSSSNSTTSSSSSSGSSGWSSTSSTSSSSSSTSSSSTSSTSSSSSNSSSSSGIPAL